MSSDLDTHRSTASDEARVLVLILSWNGCMDTLRCVHSVLTMPYPCFDVLVIDNASQDDSVQVLRDTFSDRIRLHCNQQNLLFAGGINVGLRRAMEEDYDFALILNNDVEVAPDMLEKLVACAQRRSGTAAVGPKIYYMEPRDRIWFAGGRINLWRGWSRHVGIRSQDLGQFDVERSVDYLTGCAILFRCTSLRRVGLLDTGYRMYAEDADWCFRARALGYELRFCPQARMWHRVSGGAGARSWFKINRRWRSQMRFLRKHAKWYHFATIPVFTLLEVFRVGWRLARRST